jgi:glyoxylase-like metal-dependent hydrolase (beta-lactamase superfamily II)
MMEITGTSQKQAWVDKTVPPIEQVRPLVWSVPIDFGHSPVRYTFSYLVMNESNQCIVIDPGWDSELGWHQLEEELAAAGVGLSDIVGIVSTHLHADHLGMVRQLADRTGAWIGMHPMDARTLDDYPDEREAVERDRQWAIRVGVPEGHLAETVLSAEAAVYTRDLARPTLLLEHGDLLPLEGRTLRVVFTPGHTSGHICIVDEDSELIFTGDHILPRITPNVGMTSYPDHDSLGEYYDSLGLMAEWDDFEVCPAHEYRFRGLTARAEALRKHHEDRSQEIIDTLAAGDGLTVWQIAERISWARGWSGLDGLNLRAALFETASHITYLSRTGVIEWGHPDPDSPWLANLTTTR